MLSDCPKYWDTPCTCGEYYKDGSDDSLIKTILGIVKKIPRDRAINILMRAYNVKKDERN